MATWKKVIVSGSSAELAALKVDNLTSGQVVIGGGSAGNLSSTAINGSGNIVATTGATGLSHSGSFSGSFFGNGANLTGVTATAIFPTTQLTPLGSTAQVFINDGANKYATVSQFTSASFAGVSGNITINGSGVAAIASGVVTSAMIVDATIVDGDIASATITNAKLANSTISGKALGTNLDALTIGAGLNGSSYNGSSAVTITVDSGSILPFISSSIFSRVSGDITITSAGVATIAANAVALATDISGFGGGVASVLAVNTGSAGSVVVNGGALGTPSSGTLTNATGLPISGLVSSTSTALGVGSLELGHASDTTFTRVSSGVAAIEGNNIITANNFGANVLTFLGTPSSANLATALTDETGTAGSVVFSAGPTLTGTTNVASLAASGNVTITGDLSVAGTASFTNTDNLNIRDKFILLNSGSATLADSGWVTQYNAAGSGSAFYLEAASSGTFGRFAVAYDVVGTSTSLTVDEYAVTAKIGQASAPGATTPTWGGTTNGSGNMWVTTAGDIFIYS
jgi:hypothetical protein